MTRIAWHHLWLAVAMALFAVEDIVTDHPVRAVINVLGITVNIAAAIWRIQ